MHGIGAWFSKQSIYFGIVGTIVGALLQGIVIPWVKSVASHIKSQVSRHWLLIDHEEQYICSLIGRNRWLPILPTPLIPLAEQRPRELDDIYVELSLDSAPSGAKPLSINEALKLSSRVVILGDPGAGKTTILQYLTLLFARARCKTPIGDSPEEIKSERRRVLSATKFVRSNFLPKSGWTILAGRTPLPVHLRLSRLDGAVDTGTKKSILEFLTAELRSSPLLEGLPDEFLHRYMRAGRCVFLFDAFDEAGTQMGRANAANLIQNLVTGAPRGNLFIVTSREKGYNGQLASCGFEAFKIQKLSKERINKLVTNWYAVLKRLDLVDDLLKTLHSRTRLLELAVNPMLLSLIVLVQLVHRIIPENRHILYEQCVDILVARKYSSQSVQEQYNAVLPTDEAKILLREIAIEMHRRHFRDVPRDVLTDEIIKSALQSMPMSHSSAVAPSQLLQNIEERSQLLVERGFGPNGKPIMTFSHLTFQEYLASQHLRDAALKAGEDVVTEQLLRLYEADPDWWLEVAVLYGAQLEGSSREKLYRRISLEAGPI